MPGISLLTPVSALSQAAKTVPAVRYAVGLVGIAGAVALARGFLPDVGVVAMLPILSGAIVAMAILVILAAAVASPARTPVANAFLWAVCIFVITFMLFTVTAVAFNWPPAWANLILPQRAANVSLADAARGGVVAADATSYDKPNGTISKAGTAWIERDASTGTTFEFTEVNRDDGMTTVYDRSRNVYLKWPTKGGMVQWSQTNPIAWTDLFIVEPSAPRPS